MTETDFKKISFFQQINLEAITPKNDSSEIFKNHLLVLPSHNANQMYKNNSIKTGYEHFCIKKGTLKLLPFKDFDFIGKHVVCQKCCQKFASTFSYKAHVGTSICVRNFNGPNLIYLKYKERNYRKVWEKNERKSEEDLYSHDIKKKLLNTKILKTLKTCKKVYSDPIYQQNKIKEKPMNNLKKNNDEPSVKRSEGSPRKNIVGKNVVRIKRGSPRKLNAMTVDSFSQNDNSSSSNLEINESEEPKKFNNCIADDAFINNINEDSKLKLFSSKLKNLSEKFWKFFKNECRQQGVGINEHQYSTKYQTQNNEEKQDDLSAEEKEIFLFIGELEDNLRILSEQFQGKKNYPFIDEIKFKLMLKKMKEIFNEMKQSKLKKTFMKESIPNEGKKNIKHTVENHENETEIDTNNIDFNEKEKCIKICVNNSSTSPTINIKMNDGCKFKNCTNVENIKKESKSRVSFHDNIKITTPEKTPNITNTNKNHLNDIYNPKLNCKICKINFISIAEKKLHHSKHLFKLNTQFSCTVCGLKFKMYKNFKKHINVHIKKKQNKIKYLLKKNVNT